MLIPKPTPGELAGLYLRARVFADVSWWQTSSSRIARALLSGCSAVAAAKSYAAAMWAAVIEADVADVASIEAGLRQAWEHRPPAALLAAVASDCDADRCFRETVAAYAQASSAVPA